VDSLARLRRILGDLHYQQRFLIIRNELPETPASALSDSMFEMGGDNSVFEFSGWQKGIESDLCRDFDPDIYLFANDEYLSGGLASLPVLNNECIDFVCRNTALAGRMRRIPVDVRYQGRDITPYVQTHIFLMHREIVQKLGSIVSECSSVPFIKPEYSQDMFTENEIWNDEFKDYVYHLLTQRWHGRGMRYCSENYAFFKRKVHCIINELFLSDRVRALGYPLLNLTPLPWLLDSFQIIHFPSRPVVLFQVLRNFIFLVLDRIMTETAFATFCASDLSRRLAREHLE